MPIQALPQSTVRALGSTQVLTDPASLVKELLDNALDANANSVAVCISSNTLDVIQVRDNGHGIAPQDRPMAARRYCTSKICDDEDLKDIGGSSLGFRGEALASAAELSGTLFISTRTEGEQVATSLKISQQGEVVGEERESLPVGTTVRITDFNKANPVRRQVALKHVDACLKKIKRLLQAYAFARPKVRLSLQVLKAKNKKADWVYAPKLNGNAEDAAFKIVGAQCASSCLWSVVEEQGLTLQAFLPRPDADVNKISNIGSYISIDARPVSASRGLLKQIAKVFRQSLKAADNKFDSVKEPFIFMEISGASYDANLEPAKDDVLFEHADIVLQVARQMFAMVYKPMATPVVAPEPPASVQTMRTFAEEGNDESDKSLDQELPKTPSQAAAACVSALPNATEEWIESMDRQQKAQELPASPDSRACAQMLRPNMCGYDEEDLQLFADRPSTGLTDAGFAELCQSRNDVTQSNQWVHAKMNASSKGRESRQAQRPKSPARRPPLGSDARRGSSPIRCQQGAGMSGLPTPRPSSPSPPIENSRSSDRLDLRIVRDGRLIGPANLPLPQNYTPSPSAMLRNDGLGMFDREELASSTNYPYIPGRNAPDRNTGTSLREIPDGTPRPRRAPVSRVNRPFIPPTKENQREKVWFDQPGAMGKSRPRRARQGNTDALGLVTQGEDDLEANFRPLTPPRRNRDIRDFVGRDPRSLVSSEMEGQNCEQTSHRLDIPQDEAQSIMRRGIAGPDGGSGVPRGFILARELIGHGEPTQQVEKQSCRPPKRKKTTDRAPLHELSANQRLEFAESGDDEAEYQPAAPKRAPSRRRSSKGANRTKSSRLPLERVPPSQATHKLVLNVSTHIVDVRRLAGQTDQDECLLSYNAPAIATAGGFDSVDDSDLQALAATLHRLLVTAGGDTDVVDSADLLHEVRSAFAHHAVDTEDERMLSP